MKAASGSRKRRAQDQAAGATAPSTTSQTMRLTRAVENAGGAVVCDAAAPGDAADAAASAPAPEPDGAPATVLDTLRGLLTRLLIAEVAEKALGLQPRDYDRSLQTVVGSCMARLGWLRCRVSVDGHRVWRYERGEPE